MYSPILQVSQKKINAMTHSEYIDLVNQAQRHSYEYYVLSAPTLSDADFDGLVASIEAAENEHPEWIVPDSPTQCVGSDLFANGRRTIRHRTPMLSCQKAQDMEKVTKWLNKTIKALGHNNFMLSVEWKYDGISCSLVYHDGQLISAATRGDGAIGQDITAHARLIAGIPQQLSGIQKYGRIEVRGEIVCPTANLAKMNTTYKDCRTAASSLCNMAVPSSDCALLRFIPWGVDAPCYNLYHSHFESIRFAKLSIGFEIDNLPTAFDANCPDGILEGLAMMENNRAAFHFPTDGIVIKVDDKVLAASLGFTAHHPHGSIAYKFAAQKAVTTCTAIDITVGKSGRRTPVAYFRPVTILGREVSKASLYSESNAAKLGITVGSTIEVGLSNDVTPKVYRVIGPAENQASHAPSLGCFPADDDPSTPSSSILSDDIAIPTEEEEPTEELFIVPKTHAPSLYPEVEPVSISQEDIDDLHSRVYGEEPATVDPTAPIDSPDEEEEQADASPVLKVAIGVLSVLSLIVVIPLGLALSAFGIPIINGSFI